MSAFDVEVRVQIPADQFKHIHKIATENDVTVGRLVAELVRRGLTAPTPTPKPKPARTRTHGMTTPEKLNGLVLAHEQGLSDSQIAEAVTMSAAWVQVHRTRLGLASHGRSGRRSKNTASSNLKEQNA
jgi:hypothetical protein